MDLIVEAVNRLEEQLRESGCEDGVVRIDLDPDVVICQYEKGGDMVASFGGRSAEFVTYDPIRATTRISFLYGARLEKTAQRAAACAIINVVTGFLCFSRRLRACSPERHAACRSELADYCHGKRVGTIGRVYGLELIPGMERTEDPGSADLILVTGEGLISPEGGRLLASYGEEKPMLFLSPSTAGVANLLGCDHWCPYGGMNKTGSAER